MKYRTKATIEAWQWDPKQPPTEMPGWLQAMLTFAPWRFNATTGWMCVSQAFEEYARPGDYLVYERGTVRVMAASQFESEYEPLA